MPQYPNPEGATYRTSWLRLKANAAKNGGKGGVSRGMDVESAAELVGANVQREGAGMVLFARDPMAGDNATIYIGPSVTPDKNYMAIADSLSLESLCLLTSQWGRLRQRWRTATTTPFPNGQTPRRHHCPSPHRNIAAEVTD